MSYGVPWAQAHIDALRAHLTAGQLGYRQIAWDLNEQFGTAHTKNAIVGMVSRLGLASERRFAAPREKKPRVIHDRQHALAIRTPRQQTTEFRLRCVEIVALNKNLVDLGNDDCRYIAGTDALYCGHPQQPGSSFCVPHHALCYEPRKASTRPSWRRAA